MKRRVIATVAVPFLVFGHDAFAQQPVLLLRQSPTATSTPTAAGVMRQRRVDVTSLDALRDPGRSRILQVDLFPDVSFRIVRQRMDPTAHGLSWIGTLEGYPGSTAVFELFDDEFIGDLYTPFGFFRIEREAVGGYVVQQLDHRASPGRKDDVEPTPGETRNGAAEIGWRALADSGSTIDVMVIYTQPALTNFGSDARARAAIELNVAETNEAFRASRINTSVRLVYVGPVEYVETRDSVLELGRLQSPTDGVLDEVHALRDQVAADLVVMITEEMTDYCGRAYLNNMSSRGVNGFSLVRRSCMRNGRSFAHELGHNLGAHHDWYVTAEPGAFTYSKGHVNVPGRFLDVMAYSDLCDANGKECEQLLQFSNPDLRHDGRVTGIPAGTSLSCTAGLRTGVECDADAASTLNSMAAVVAGYRNSRLALSARRLLPGGAIRSDNGRFRLAYQTDGNLVFYDDREQLALWSANSGGTSAGEMLMQTDGNLVVRDGNGTVRWMSGTAGNPNAYFVVTDDGNLVVYRADGQPIWDRHQ